MTAEEDASLTQKKEPESKKTRESEGENHMHSTEKLPDIGNESSEVFEIIFKHDLQLAAQETRIATVQLLNTYKGEEHDPEW